MGKPAVNGQLEGLRKVLQMKQFINGLCSPALGQEFLCWVPTDVLLQSPPGVGALAVTEGSLHWHARQPVLSALPQRETRHPPLAGRVFLELVSRHCSRPHTQAAGSQQVQPHSQWMETLEPGQAALTKHTTPGWRPAGPSTHVPVQGCRGWPRVRTGSWPCP